MTLHVVTDSFGSPKRCAVKQSALELLRGLNNHADHRDKKTTVDRRTRQRVLSESAVKSLDGIVVEALSQHKVAPGLNYNNEVLKDLINRLQSVLLCNQAKVPKDELSACFEKVGLLCYHSGCFEEAHRTLLAAAWISQRRKSKCAIGRR